MGYNLVIDQGNSAAKLAVFQGDEFVKQWRYDVLDPSRLEEIAALYKPDVAIYCSVACRGEELIVTLRGLCRKVYEMTSLLPLPITIGYTTPVSLGRDRIAAVAGARAIYPGRNVLVVDAGTAVTYDVLTADGEFKGGNIAPGLWMRAEALNKFTSHLPYVDTDPPGEVPLWGTDTRLAIKCGVVRGIVGEIEYYSSLMPADSIVMLTGGDALRLAEFVESQVEVDPLLVCKGLNSILLYNEQN